MTGILAHAIEVRERHPALGCARFSWTGHVLESLARHLAHCSNGADDLAASRVFQFSLRLRLTSPDGTFRRDGRKRKGKE